jgi:ribonuclease G
MMEKLLLATRDALNTRLALLEDGRLVEYFQEPTRSGGLVGNLFVGKVSRILPGVDCAFIDIGMDRDGFLYEGDMGPLIDDEFKFETSSRYHPVIEDLKLGEPLLVQVTKEPMGQKGPRLTTQISLPGNYLVYMPQTNRIGASKKLSDSERHRLKKTLSELKGDFHGSFIARTAAEGASREDLASEMQQLAELWSLLMVKMENGSHPYLLHQEADLATKAVREILLRSEGELITDDEALSKKVLESLMGVSEKDIRITLWKNKISMFKDYKIDEELENALKPRVWMRSGGCIVIQPTEALVAIDVNSGRFVGRKSLEETAFKTNMEAAEEVVRQLRLRNLGGIIVIDFIDMTEKGHRDELVSRLQEHLKTDKARSRILKISEFGLVEMTRKRTHKPLEKLLTSSCPCCEGKGKIPAPWKVVEAILSQLSRITRNKKYKVSVSTHVYKFIEENREFLNMPAFAVFEEVKIKDPSRYEIQPIDEKAFGKIAEHK